MMTRVRFAQAVSIFVALCMLGFGLTASAQEFQIITFDAPGADMTPFNFNGTFATSINKRGAITGYYVDVNFVSHGFLRSPDGELSNCGRPKPT